MDEQKRKTQMVALIARKGGVTKTTLTGNIGAALAQRGYRVVIAESDGQGSLSKMVGVKPHDAFYGVVAEDAEWADVLVKVPEKFAGTLPEGGELWLLSSFDGQMNLAAWDETGSRVYERFNELRGWADFVLVDTSPTIDAINNAWFYTMDWLLLPTLCERPSVDQLRDQTLFYVKQAQKQVAQLPDSGLKAAQVLGIVPNRYAATTNVDRVNIGIIHGRHADDYHVFPMIRDTVGWKKAAQLRMSVLTLCDHEDSASRYQARAAMRELSPVVDRVIDPFAEVEEVFA